MPIFNIIAWLGIFLVLGLSLIVPHFSLLLLLMLGFLALSDSYISSFKLRKALYLKSTRWTTIRSSIMLRDSYICQMCSSTQHLEVHHVSYKRMGHELPSDLITVCRQCHQHIHDTYGYNYLSNFPIIKE